MRKLIPDLPTLLMFVLQFSMWFYFLMSALHKNNYVLPTEVWILYFIFFLLIFYVISLFK
jgi:hypothetical protein